jgi:hypothetical protein
MKKNILYSVIVAISVAGALSLRAPQSAITGSVLPANGADSVWAVSEKDSARGVIINTGNFSLSVKPGVYKLIVDAKSPYKDVLLENLDVKDEQPLDVGQIVLQK